MTHRPDHGEPAEPPRILLFSGFTLLSPAGAVPVPMASRRLLAYLALRGRSSRLEVAGTLWPDVPEGRALASLRTALWRTAQTGQRVARVTTETVELDPGVVVDVQTFTTAAQSALHGRDADLPDLRSLWAGELLPGWYDDWVVVEREAVRLTQLHALEAVAERLLRLGRPVAAMEAALTAVRLDPLRESATRLLVLSHLGLHNVAEAVRAFEHLRVALEDELGVAPSADLHRLVARSTSRSPAPARSV